MSQDVGRRDEQQARARRNRQYGDHEDRAGIRGDPLEHPLGHAGSHLDGAQSLRLPQLPQPIPQLQQQLSIQYGKKIRSAHLVNTVTKTAGFGKFSDQTSSVKAASAAPRP